MIFSKTFKNDGFGYLKKPGFTSITPINKGGGLLKLNAPDGKVETCPTSTKGSL